MKTARYDEISNVQIERGMTFAELKLKTRCLLSGETSLVTGLSVGDAERAKVFIEEHMVHES